MPYLTLTYADGHEQVVEVDATPRLQVTTGDSREFSEHSLVAAEYVAEEWEPEPEKKK